jgi:antitoxin MazE
MESVVAKWGNSLALRIPHGLADELGLHEDSHVNVAVDGNKLVITRGLTLTDMLSSLTSENKNILEDWGAPVGREDFI